MNREAIESMQARLDRIQVGIIETVKSEENEVEITMNGKLEVLQLKINKALPEQILESVLAKTFNETIKYISGKLQAAMLSK